MASKKTKRQSLTQISRFSEFLNLDPKTFVASGVLDPIVGVDVKVFIDPQRLFLTAIPEFQGARSLLEKYFADTFRTIRLSKNSGDQFYRRAVQRLTFKEIKGVGIGFGRETDDGRGIGPELARRLVETATLLDQRAVDDPAVFELLGLFEEDFGPDRLSDLTIFILRKQFLGFTARVSAEIGIPDLRDFEFEAEKFKVPFRLGTKIPIILLPLDLIRDLPIATDANEIKDAGYLNKELRDKWRDLLNEAYKAGKQQPAKEVAKQLFLDNPTFFEALVTVYRENKSGPYDFMRDPKGLLSWANFAMDFASRFPLDLLRDIKTSADLEKIVSLIIEQFRKNIEQNGLNKLLYKENGTPQREAFAQLLFFASADAYCRANGLDLSPESDAGRGPVDFKVSKGQLKTVVEIKLSKHSRLLTGFEEQLEIYKGAERAQNGFYVVVKVTDAMPIAMKDIEALIKKRKQNGEPTSIVKIVDATLLPSASKPQRKKKDKPS